MTEDSYGDMVFVITGDQRTGHKMEEEKKTHCVMRKIPKSILTVKIKIKLFKLSRSDKLGMLNICDLCN